MLSTFKSRLIIVNSPNSLGEKLIRDGLMWHFQIGNPELPTVDTSWEEFELTKEEILFSAEQIKKYGKGLRLDPFDTEFGDETKYELYKHYQRGKVQYEIKIKKYTLVLVLSKWDKFKLNIIHDRYWLFNEKKWFVTFAISILALIVAIIALFIKTKR